MLFDMVQAYCDTTGCMALIAYDGSQKERSHYGTNPGVIFGRKSETADTVIESIVSKFTSRKASTPQDYGSVRVVTDDRMVANMVSGMGAFCISVNAFARDLDSAMSSLKGLIEDTSNNLDNRIRFGQR